MIQVVPSQNSILPLPDEIFALPTPAGPTCKAKETMPRDPVTAKRLYADPSFTIGLSTLMVRSSSFEAIKFSAPLSLKIAPVPKSPMIPRAVTTSRLPDGVATNVNA